jgi:hypothetical protein
MEKRKVELFTAGCPPCGQTVDPVKALACPSCEVTVLDVRDAAAQSRALAVGVTRVPTVVVDGRVAGCCEGGAARDQLRRAGVGIAP